MILHVTTVMLMYAMTVDMSVENVTKKCACFVYQHVTNVMLHDAITVPQPVSRAV